MSIGMFEGDLVFANEMLLPQANVRIAGFFHQGFAAGFTPNKVDGVAVNACFVQDSALTG